MKKLRNLLWIALTIIYCSCSTEDSLKENIESDPLMGDVMFVCTSDFMNLESNKNQNGKLAAIVSKNLKWFDGQTIRVKFLNGNTDIQEKTKEYINNWIQYTNLTVQFVPSSEFAEIILFTGTKEECEQYIK